ncbi:MAG: ChbG/HpnK family deacetylase [Methylophilaceae bacterium]
MKPIIISADDYAQSCAIDDAIIRLIQKERLSATSCLTLSPHWPQAAKLLTGDVRAKADIGLHLDFTQYGQSIKLPLPTLILRTFIRSLPSTKIEASINQQLDKFEEALGSQPDYVDGHQHVHQLPQIRDALIDILKKRYPNRLPWIRIAKPPIQDGIKGMIISMLGANTLANKARRAGFRCSFQLLGVYEFNGSTADYLRKLTDWFHYAQCARHHQVHAFMCHPAIEEHSSDHIETDDMIYPARLREYEVFSSDQFARLLTQHQLYIARGNAL